MSRPMPMTLTELDEYFKQHGLQAVINRYEYHVDDRRLGERIEVTIEASGFRVNELYNLTPADDLKNFDNILKEAVKNENTNNS